MASIPTSRDEYDRRWAGVQAHNRWLVDFCGEAPGRRAGLAQLFINDVPDMLDAIAWSKDNGMKGVLLPAVRPDHPLVPPLWSDYYEPVWSLCEELQIPVNQHGASGLPNDFDPLDPTARAVMLYEMMFFSRRTLWHLILGGVFERHPRLKFIMTEQGASWVRATLSQLDGLVGSCRVPDESGLLGGFAGEAVSKLSLLPSEYFAQNCYIATPLTRSEVQDPDGIGRDLVMWGSDFPHSEGTYPFSVDAMRMAFAGMSQNDCARVLGLNAAEVYGLDHEFLYPIAQQIGPSVEEINTPLQAKPADTRTCPVFAEWVEDTFQ